MRKIIITTAFAAATLILGACGETPTRPNSTPVTAPSATAPPATPSPTTTPAADVKTDPKAETLVGKWQGVEGTYLNITEKDGKYSVEIKDLDKAETFDGTKKGDVIEFTRKGKTETVKHATGEETGMKYLLEEKNCVVITKGSEGYCRK